MQKYFNRAGATYLQEAKIQQEAARECAVRVPGKYYPRVLEIGAGGGLLTGQCLDRIQAGLYLAMDISLPMLKLIPRDRTVLLRADGEHPPFKKAVFDLLVSASVMQWYSKPPQGLLENLELLKKGGRFSISLFVSGTFRQMQEISSRSGFGSVYPLPGEEEYLSRLQESGMDFGFQTREYTRYFPSVPEFLKSHRRTGARYTLNRPSFGKKTYSRFCREYERIYGQDGWIPVDYRVLYIWGKKIIPGPGPGPG